MKRMSMISLTVLSFLVLSACGAKPQSKSIPSSSTVSQSSSTSVTSSTSSAPTSSRSSETSQPALWTSDQYTKLQDYILGYWGPAMGQDYTAYPPSYKGNFFGVTLPDGVLTATAEMTADMGGQTPELVWSTDGLAKSGQLAVVAVYADTERHRSMVHHLYVFTLNPQGQGQIWISQQNQGNPENKLYFKETQNHELRNFFIQLVGSETTTEATAPQAVGVDTKNLTIDQAANWAAAHKAKGYGSPYTRADFITMVTGIDKSPDGLVYIEVRENHNSPTMRAAGADKSVASNLSMYRINADGHLERNDVVKNQYVVVETNYYD